MPNPSFPSVVELNVGGVNYTTSLITLTSETNSLLWEIFTGKSANQVVQDAQGRYFIDRDGTMFRHILNYLRNKKVIPPDTSSECERLRVEAEYYRLPKLVSELLSVKVYSMNQLIATPPLQSALSVNSVPGYITIGYRGSFAFGRDGLADVKFRKLFKILVSGKVQMCRDVFGESLNESRDPDHGGDDRYTARFFLKHLFLEQAFDSLQEAGFRCVGACGSGTSCGGNNEPQKPGIDSEEIRWMHYNEFVFCRP